MHTTVTYEDGDRPEIVRDGMDLEVRTRDTTVRMPVAAVPWLRRELRRVTKDRGKYANAMDSGSSAVIPAMAESAPERDAANSLRRKHGLPEHGTL